MSVDKTAKKIAFISSVKANAVALKAYRDTATALRERMSSDPGISDLADGDGVFTGDNAYMNTVIINNYLGVTTDIEKALTNQAVATSNRLPSFLSAVPGS